MEVAFDPRCFARHSWATSLAESDDQPLTDGKLLVVIIGAIGVNLFT
jgi:hypothetical protein